MKKQVFFHKLLIFVISVVMIFSLTSCTQQKKPIPQPKKSQEQQNKPPKELEELSKSVEKVEKTLVDMYKRNKKPLFIQQEEIKKQEQKQNKEQEKQGGQEQQDGGSKSSDGGDKSGSSGQQGSKQPSEVELVTPKDKMLEFQYETQKMQIEVDRANLTQFEQLKKDIIELHSLWNAYEAKAVSQFVMQSSIIDFEDSLNNLTKSIENKDIYQSLLDVTQLYKYLPDFYMVYSSEAPPEIGKIRFAAKKISLLGDKENYEAAKQTLDYLTGIWMLARPRFNQESIDMINQFEFAASDLKNAIEEKNSMIIVAKTEVMLKIADELEKSSGKKEKKQ